MEEKAQVFNDTSHIEAQFVEIKEHAWKKDKLPKDCKYTIVDERYFQAMKCMYEKYRMKLVHRGEAEKEVDMLRLRYRTDKMIEEKRVAGSRADSDRRMRASQSEAKLIKEDLSLREIYRTLFFELMPKLIPPPSAEKMFKSIVVKMWSCGSLANTPENIEAIRKIIMEEENA